MLRVKASRPLYFYSELLLVLFYALNFPRLFFLFSFFLYIFLFYVGSNGVWYDRHGMSMA